MNCSRCGKESIVLHRANPLGEVPAVWLCIDCVKEQGVIIDPEVKEICEIVAGL